MRQTKEMRLVYSDFLAQVGQEDTTIAAIEEIYPVQWLPTNCPLFWVDAMSM